MDKELKASKSDNVVEDSRRDFLKRFGKYAAVTPVALTTLMSPGIKAAPSSAGLAHGKGKGLNK